MLVLSREHQWRHARSSLRQSPPGNNQIFWQNPLQNWLARRRGRNCPLWRNATQTVFGEGGSRSQVMFVGEQPGNDEDLSGKPFVGPAGRLLDTSLAEAGIDRKKVYVTNVVKHFKWEPRGKRRIHKKPSVSEIAACRPWLDARSHRLDRSSSFAWVQRLLRLCWARPSA